ncbi:MAG: proton-conducting transporter membrane subunit [Desulfurococcaceae archaeon]
MELALQLLGLLTPGLIISAFAIPISKFFKWNRVPGLIAIVSSLFAVVSTTLMLYHVYEHGPVVYTYGGWPPHFGIVYEVDLFNAMLGAFTSWIMFTVVLYSVWYSHHIDDPVWYYILLLGLETGILGCLYTGDAFNLFVMLEVLGISAYGLVAYHRDKAESVEASSKYALIGAVATTFYFTAVIVLYAGYGTVNIALLSWLSRVANQESIQAIKYLSLFSVGLALWVFTYKSALFPNHFWLPDAHPEAPTPISAALSGLVVNVGVYATIRFLYTIFGEGSIAIEYRAIVLSALFILGSISGLIGALMMMIQKDIKRLLAYSTICHMGIIYMGLSIGFITNSREAITLAMTGTIVHVIAHGIAKALLFMASGILIDASGSRDLDEMRGIGRFYPLTSLSLLFGFLSLAGFIPFIGFYSKLLIALGYVDVGFTLGAVLIIVISALSIPGYLKAISSIIFATSEKQVKRNKPLWIEYLLLIMALSLLALGVVFYRTSFIYSNTARSVLMVEEYILKARELIPIELLDKYIVLKGG